MELYQVKQIYKTLHLVSLTHWEVKMEENQIPQEGGFQKRGRAERAGDGAFFEAVVALRC